MRYIFEVRCEATYFPKLHLGTRLVPTFGHMNIQKCVYMTYLILLLTWKGFKKPIWKHVWNLLKPFMIFDMLNREYFTAVCLEHTIESIFKLYSRKEKQFYSMFAYFKSNSSELLCML